MSARVAQLIARYVGIALTAISTFLFGQDFAAQEAGKIADWSDGVAAIVIGVVSLLISELIHRALAGSVLTPPGKAKQGVAPPALLALLASGALLACAVSNTGCAGAGSLRAAEYDPVATRVLDYADARAASDPLLTDAQRREALLDSALLRGAFDAALGRAPTPTAFGALYPAAPAPID